MPSSRAFDIDELVHDCLDAVRSEGASADAAVEQIIQRTVADPGRVEKVTGPPADAPLLSTWHNSDELTVLHIVWPPEVDLMPHDHRMWAVIGLYGGREDNAFYRLLPDSSLEATTSETFRGGDAVRLDEATVHAVANPSRQWTGAIHVYGGDFFRSGRRMWPDRHGPAIDYDPDRVVSVLQEAARRERG